MRNKTLPRIAQVFGFIVSLAVMHSSNAVQITMTLPDCPSGQSLTFTPSTNTLSCGGTQAPVHTPNNCAITASPDSSANAGLQAGTQVTLTALCSGGLTPLSYSWNIGVIGSSLTVAPGNTTQYTVTPSNSAGVGATFSTTVYIGNTGGGGGGGSTPTAPSGCSISQSPNTPISPVNAGASVTLSMACSSGTAVSSCAWSNAIPGSACTVLVTAPAASTAYTATASNSVGSAQASATIYVNATTGGGNGGGGGGTTNPTGQNFCTGSDTIISVPWPAAGQVKPNTNGFNNQRIAFKVTIPATFSPQLNINHLGFMRIVEVPGATVTGRDYTISKNACDFQSGAYILNGIGLGDTAPYISFSANNPLGYLAAGAMMNFQSGDTVYFNVRNYNDTNPTCPYSSCDISIDFATPNRY